MSALVRLLHHALAVHVRPPRALLPVNATVMARMPDSLTPCARCARWFKVDGFAAACPACGKRVFEPVKAEPRRREREPVRYAAGARGCEPAYVGGPEREYEV